MCEQKKECKLYRKILTKGDSDYDVIEIAIVNCHGELNNFELTIIEFKKDFRNNIQKIDSSMPDARVRFDEITESNKWERLNALDSDIENLEKCFYCDETDKCLKCNCWITKFKPSKITQQ